MKGQNQTDTTPNNGDALRACVASIFEEENDSLPNFIADPRGYLPALQEWLQPNYAFLKVRLLDGRLEFPFQAPDNFSCYCVLAGPSPRGAHKHCVVGKVVDSEFEVAHDPYPSGGNLAGSPEWAGFFLSLHPAKP
ncbi:hypothetical protein CYMTET_27106 [Cymbomonas tetramitiformis]|uniref:Uncharacterized protein n=1 Tax=Cymbomonas tetramitiformis TaxID=36881 RepID=A0AAE0FQQ9_9CHLO|nr:hypothetical protein CYMTET_27106 [Cymbomonas tetramitiformis]